jgi:plastocyanin
MMIRNRNLARRLLPLIVLSIFALQASAAPQIEIVDPKEGAQVPAGNVTIMVNVTDFYLVNKLGSANEDNEGHIHYYMDVAVPKTPDKPAVTASGTFAPTANTSFTWRDVSPGSHNFSVQLVHNDHTPLIPLVYAEINVTAVAGAMKDPQSVTIGLIAKNIAYNTTTITVPAGADVTVNFDNEDANVPHNFAVYTDSSASTAIFKGEIITGPNKTTYSFVAPSTPGTYFFRCDVHPTIMTGQFIVT